MQDLSKLMSYFGLVGKPCQEDVKKVYRWRVAQMHPDKGGVNIDEYIRLQDNYKAIMRLLPRCSMCYDSGYIYVKGMRRVCECKKRR